MPAYPNLRRHALAGTELASACTATIRLAPRDDRRGHRTKDTSKGFAVVQPVALVGYSVGTVPPSIRYSDPAIEADRGEARKAIRSATSPGVAGLPTGIPPSQSITIFLPPS